MATDFIQIPPDSTGKKIRHTERHDIGLNNLTSDINLLKHGDILTGETSGVTGVFVGKGTRFGETQIYVTDKSGTFTIGENISSFEYTNFGSIKDQISAYTPSVAVSDPDRPFNRMKIDDEGGAFVRFAEGIPGFDTFGHTQQTSPNIIEGHSWIYGDRGVEKYGDTIDIGGDIRVASDSSELILSTNTLSGSRAIRQTHQYYPYTPGVGTEILMSLRLNNQGQTGTVSKWGLFDDNDGLFFEVSGSVTYVGIRSNITGTVIETHVPQSEWNGNRLENATEDKYQLDVSKYNLYWIDFAWLGINKIRFGTYAPSGERITIHTFENTNNLLLPYARRGTLPLRLEQFNTSNTSGPSELRTVCASIQQQSKTEYLGKLFSVGSNSITVSGSSIPIISVRPQTTFGGKDNRITYFATDIEYIIKGSAVILETYIQPTLIGSTFSSPSSSFQSLQVDTDATSYTGGVKKETITISGQGIRDIKESFENAISNFADGTPLTMTFTARTVHPGDTADVYILLRWKEVH